MNNKNTVLIALLVFCSIGLSFAVEIDNKIHQDRYNTIVDAFSVENRAFDFEFVPQKDDVTIVEEHQKKFQDQLLKKQAIFDQSYRPLLLKIGGWLSLIRTGALSLTSVMLGLMALTWGQPDITATQEDLEDFVKDFDLKKSITQKEASNLLSWYSLGSMVYAGAYGGLSYYLFNKAASYKKELEELQYGIDLDKAMILALLDLPFSFNFPKDENDWEDIFVDEDYE